MDAEEPWSQKRWRSIVQRGYQQEEMLSLGWRMEVVEVWRETQCPPPRRICRERARVPCTPTLNFWKEAPVEWTLPWAHLGRNSPELDIPFPCFPKLIHGVGRIPATVLGQLWRVLWELGWGIPVSGLRGTEQTGSVLLLRTGQDWGKISPITASRTRPAYRTKGWDTSQEARESLEGKAETRSSPHHVGVCNQPLGEGGRGKEHSPGRQSEMSSILTNCPEGAKFLNLKGKLSYGSKMFFFSLWWWAEMQWSWSSWNQLWKCAQLGSNYKFQTLHNKFELCFTRMMVVHGDNGMRGKFAYLYSCSILSFSVKLWLTCTWFILGSRSGKLVLSRTIRVVHWVFQSFSEDLDFPWF